MIHDLYIWTVALDPGKHVLEHTLGMSAIIANDYAGDVRGSMLVIRSDFCAGEVELALEARKQGFQPGAFILQGSTSREVEFEDQRANMHHASLDEEHNRHKQLSWAII